MKTKTLLLVIVCAVITGTVAAFWRASHPASGPTTTAPPEALKLPAVFGQHMVLQRDKPVNVWGWAPPGQRVELRIATQTRHAQADDRGDWSITLDPMPAGGPFVMEVSTQTGSISLDDILIGDVWICSGQSNMEMTVAPDYYPGVNDYEKILAEADQPRIRLFKVRNRTSSRPETDVQAAWHTSSSKKAAGFSAVAYFFGKRLHEELGIPIGLISTSWGGTPSEAWTSRSALESLPSARKTLDAWDQTISRYKPDPRQPEQRAPANSQRRPANLFNAMVHPLIPYTIRGAIWYQGEQNVSRAKQYQTLFPLMIRDWRERWGQGDFPFYFVQIANYTQPTAQPAPSAMAELREAQLMALMLPNTAMAVSIDIGDADDIHPRNKQEVARRLALCALANEYGRTDITYSGPLYQRMAIEPGRIRLYFDHADGGLVARDGPLQRFQIAGADRQFVWADARIDGDTVVVSSKHVPAPRAVRYAWADNPQGCNLYNGQGLPASPFRTDRWPGITTGKTIPRVK
jgi:sialate O-acetylesterase